MNTSAKGLRRCRWPRRHDFIPIPTEEGAKIKFVCRFCLVVMYHSVRVKVPE